VKKLEFQDEDGRPIEIGKLEDERGRHIEATDSAVKSAAKEMAAKSRAQAGEAEAESQIRGGSSLVRGTTEVSGLTILLLALAFISLILGGLLGWLGITGLVAAVVFALFARIAQSGRQHAEMMDALRALKERVPD